MTENTDNKYPQTKKQGPNTSKKKKRSKKKRGTANG